MATPTVLPSSVLCPETGDKHRWRRQTKKRMADCPDCGFVRCAGYVSAGKGILVNRCPMNAIAYPDGVPSCPDHAGNPGSTRC